VRRDIPEMGKTIAVVSGYWSTNIGNSFFQLGAEYALRQAFPGARIVLVADQPGYYNVKGGTPRNALIPLEYMPVDYLVILGPFLRPEYESIWGSTIERLLKCNVRIMILSAGMMDYGAGLVERSRHWLARLKPYVFTTRDEETYHNFADLAEYAFNGIDVAFFVSDFYTPVPLEIGEYVVLNFDRIPEPCIDILDHKDRTDKADFVFQFKEKVWGIRFPPLRTLLSRRSRIFSFVEPLLWRRHLYPGQIDGMQIVRTDHRFNPLVLRKVYKRPNSLALDIPWPYLDIYSQASCVLSNRVHACVAALAYEKPAMLFSRTPRVRLLERVGADEITQKPALVSPERLQDEKAALLEFLSQIHL
jgi:hypothetical protein